MEKNSRKDSQITFNTSKTMPKAKHSQGPMQGKPNWQSRSTIIKRFPRDKQIVKQSCSKKNFSLKNLKNKIPKMKQNTRVLIFQAANFEASAFGNSSSTSSKYILKSASHIPPPPTYETHLTGLAYTDSKHPISKKEALFVYSMTIAKYI